MDASRVNVRTSDTDTVFFVRQAARSDSGEYELTVQIENMKDTATLRIRVVGAWPGRGGGTGAGRGQRRWVGEPGWEARTWEWGAGPRGQDRTGQVRVDV